MIGILINGISGQMGHTIYQAANASGGTFSVVAGVDASGAADPAIACPVYKTYDGVKETPDVVIDFSVPAALPAVLRFAQSRGIPAVIGTTGLNERDRKLIQTAAERIPVFQTGNMSLGVNLQMALTKTAAAALGSDFDVEIIEKHHRKKIDAPSGTALMLARAVSSQYPGELQYVCGRAEKNKRRSDAEIGIHSIRGGTLAGEHEVLFLGNDETVSIHHAAYSKQVFARGALRAAKYLIGKGPGLYDMQNVVSEHDVASHLYTLEDQAVIVLSGLPFEAGTACRVFDEIAKQGVFVDMIALSVGGNSQSVGFSLREAQLMDAETALRTLQRDYPALAVTSHGDVVKMTVEGSGMALRHGVAAQLFSVLAEAGIKRHLVTTSETKIEFCVDAMDAAHAVEAVQSRFLPEA